MSWRIEREREEFLRRCREDFEAARSQPLVITLFGPLITGQYAGLRRALGDALGKHHAVNICEELPKPGGYEDELKVWEAIQLRNSDLLLHLPESPGSIGELVYLTYPELAGKAVIFCQEEHRGGYVEVALLREHEAKHGHVYYYSKKNANAQCLLQEIDRLLRYLSCEKWLRLPERRDV